MIYYLGLGANLGEREKNIRAAIDYIKKIPDTKILRVSSFYETKAWGAVNQPDFVNAAIKISSELAPLKLLDELQRIEKILGRVRLEHWGARTIDIDILFAEGLRINSERLTIPHKFLFERDFALIPLAEIFHELKFNLHGDEIKKIVGSPKDFSLKIIACVDKNFGLGYKNNLLFKIPADMKNFRKLTLNNTIIYGRKTLLTFPDKKILPSRRNIIFSRTLENICNAEIIKNISELWEKLKVTEKNFVIGGGEIFSELMPYTEEIFLTVIDDEKIADSFFPTIGEEFNLNSLQKFEGDINFEIRKYLRVGGKNFAETDS